VSINIEAEIIGWLSQKVAVPVSADVPADKPDRFITIERTGGSRDNHVVDRPNLAIQCWGTSRLDASELAYEVDAILPSIVEIPQVTHFERDTFYNFPDEHGAPRYQIVVNLTTTI
jgi:hypothetical protein